MELLEFAKLVKRMRDEQNSFFRTRNKVHLDNAKKIEVQVDREISNLIEEPKNQQSLF